jgi:hypothetical protein
LVTAATPRRAPTTAAAVAVRKWVLASRPGDLHPEWERAISRAPLEKLQAYKRRLGWSFPWASSYGSDYNFDPEISLPREITRELQAGFSTVSARVAAKNARATGTDPVVYLSEY